jgi:hypothetical protein
MPTPAAAASLADDPALPRIDGAVATITLTADKYTRSPPVT